MSIDILQEKIFALRNPSVVGLDPKPEYIPADIMEKCELLPRKADLRAFVLMGEEPMVWKSGLTRF